VPSTDDPTTTAFVVPHTHWDREWYRPFQVFRARLVDVIDEVLDILDSDPAYRRFTLDGQAVVLEDYLEVRPEARERLARHVQDGRLRIGPWYVLADEFLVSPEALIRNLALGRRVCQAFGPPLPIGYTPDSFGHVSQLPLFLRGFGLESAVFMRGVGDEGERLRGEFRWLAADGDSEVFAVHLLGTYSAAAALGHLDWQLTDAYDPRRAVEQVSMVLHGADGRGMQMPAWIRETFERLPRGILPYSTGGAVLLLNGSDHLFPQRDLPAIVAQLNEAFPDVRFVHGDIEEFMAAAREGTRERELETYQGEFRGSRYQHVLPSVLSTRLYLKQANHAAETLLERFAEPLATLAWLEGHTHDGALLRQAWRQLLLNHPHDSICGCSVDAVHQEMMTRFAGVTQLGEVVIERAARALVGAPGDEAVAVFNPLPYARRAVATLTLDLPAGHGSELTVRDAAGNAVPSQVTARTLAAAGRSDRQVDHTTLRFLASLPPMGMAGFSLASGAGTRPPATLEVTAEAGGVTLQNPSVRVDVAADGSLTLEDRATGERFPLGLSFEDVADAGDEYNFSPLAGDAPLTIAAPEGGPRVLDAGPVTARVGLTYRASLPARLTADRRRREGTSELAIEVELSLDAVGSVVGLKAMLDNRAEDHRLRLRLATGCRTERAIADGHFDVIERPARPTGGDGWYEAPQPTSHQRRFVAVSDGSRGLALVNRGLPEYEAIPTATGIDLAITLLRCVGWLSREDLASRPQGAGPSMAAPGGQCPGSHTFELGLLPLIGAWDEGDALAEIQGFHAAPHVARCAAPAPARSWLELTPPLELTAFKHADAREAVIARVYNPSRRPVRGSLRLWAPPAEAYLATLAEEPGEALAADGRDIALELAPKAVATLFIVPQALGPS